ncbi:hypothetical protein [Bacteroidetes bacterium endosymbiont of Geopemphigus sp.]|uniref:hypothetical protein n=1 Tax=Bacteroidetes bacterium endosymbiont of Geopemphigus sp. TaxID=2047937 RepID=UPI0011AFC138|nr:hypothetical protein [Bacteroidetes bacterium endosymbiont of Geopemphigus sp.]
MSVKDKSCMILTKTDIKLLMNRLWFNGKFQKIILSNPRWTHNAIKTSGQIILTTMASKHEMLADFYPESL